MPESSAHDSRFIDTKIRNFGIFPHVRNWSIRRKLQARLLRCPRIITIGSFHRDMILLEACYRPLRSLFPTMEITLREDCISSFEHDWRYFEVNYRELWICVISRYPHLSSPVSKNLKKDRKNKGPTTDQSVMSQLASFAASRGFTNSEIQRLLGHDEVNLGLDALPEVSPKLSQDEEDLPLQYRCSRPSLSDFEKEWHLLSLENIYELPEQAKKDHPTAYAVARDTVRCFLGLFAPFGIGHAERFQRHDRTIAASGFGSEGNAPGTALRGTDSPSYEDQLEHVSPITIGLKAHTGSSRSSNSPEILTTERTDQQDPVYDAQTTKHHPPECREIALRNHSDVLFLGSKQCDRDRSSIAGKRSIEGAIHRTATASSKGKRRKSTSLDEARAVSVRHPANGQFAKEGMAVREHVPTMRHHSADRPSSRMIRRNADIHEHSTAELSPWSTQESDNTWRETERTISATQQGDLSDSLSMSYDSLHCSTASEAERSEESVHTIPRPSNCWERSVDHVRSKFNRLRADYVCVFTPADIPELLARRHPSERRILVWLKAEKDLFHRQMASLLSKGYEFKAVSADEADRKCERLSIGHVEYWNMCTVNQSSACWIASLRLSSGLRVPAGRARQKRTLRTRIPVLKRR